MLYSLLIALASSFLLLLTSAEDYNIQDVRSSRRLLLLRRHLLDQGFHAKQSPYSQLERYSQPEAMLHIRHHPPSKPVCACATTPNGGLWDCELGRGCDGQDRNGFGLGKHESHAIYTESSPPLRTRKDILDGLISLVDHPCHLQTNFTPTTLTGPTTPSPFHHNSSITNRAHPTSCEFSTAGDRSNMTTLATYTEPRLVSTFSISGPGSGSLVRESELKHRLYVEWLEGCGSFGTQWFDCITYDRYDDLQMNPNRCDPVHGNRTGEVDWTLPPPVGAGIERL
ncbi:hypothetical protein K491DRAFT_677530 [Lophiostoma macrostomum CBS 122681]|uniref:Uncharacterized protein n=1 Tax=Lophiostoma macrostomum CBS 122681 TaxID=1314788 RepID=A0A6A6TB41_9PLEO|nr:hypothetical protein K491DRAFT_677530 [Lophiostoma macrostomum CBS 122681]